MNKRPEQIIRELEEQGKTIREVVDEEMINGKHKYKYEAMNEVAKRLGMNEQTINLKYYANTKKISSKNKDYKIDREIFASCTYLDTSGVQGFFSGIINMPWEAFTDKELLVVALNKKFSQTIQEEIGKDIAVESIVILSINDLTDLFASSTKNGMGDSK